MVELVLENLTKSSSRTLLHYFSLKFDDGHHIIYLLRTKFIVVSFLWHFSLYFNSYYKTLFFIRAYDIKTSKSQAMIDHILFLITFLNPKLRSTSHILCFTHTRAQLCFILFNYENVVFVILVYLKSFISLCVEVSQVLKINFEQLSVTLLKLKFGVHIFRHESTAIKLIQILISNTVFKISIHSFIRYIRINP